MTRIALWAMAVLVPFTAWYVLWGRTWLKPKPWMQWLYHSRVGEWAEIYLFSKSESVLWGRFLQFVGYGTSAILTFGNVDLTPLALVLPENLQWIPPVMPVVLSVAGHIQVKLRKDTKTPLDMIAMSEADKQKPEVKAAIKGLDKAKVEAAVAVASVKEEAVVKANAGRD